jgi:hypothetical protein
VFHVLHHESFHHPGVDKPLLEHFLSLRMNGGERRLELISSFQLIILGWEWVVEWAEEGAEEWVEEWVEEGAEEWVEEWVEE